MMSKREASKYRHIESFDELRQSKRDLDREIVEAGNKVTSATEHLLDEGVKVIAAGVAGFLVSRILSVFISSRKSAESSGKQPQDKSSQAASSAEEASGRDDRFAQAEAKAHRNSGQNGASKLDTALVWLETISGGIEAAKVVLGSIVEAQQTKEEGSTEETDLG